MSRGRRTIFRVKRSIAVQIEQITFDEMAAEALKVGLSASVWARMIILDKLRELRNANGTK